MPASRGNRSVEDRDLFARNIAARVPGTLAGETISEVRTRDGVKIVLKSGSWVLLRPSGTEPLIRTYAETQNIAKTDRLLNWAQKVASIS